jgi:hypothetical protein
MDTQPAARPLRTHSQIEMHAARIVALGEEDFSLDCAADKLHPRCSLLRDDIDRRRQDIAAEIDAIYAALSFLKPSTLCECVRMFDVVSWNAGMIATDADKDSKKKRLETIDRLLNDVYQALPNKTFFDHEIFGIETHPETAAILRSIEEAERQQEVKPVAQIAAVDLAA